MKILELENEYNAKLIIDLYQVRAKSSSITIKDIIGSGEKNFLLNPNHIEEIKKLFVGDWVEIVTKEDLKTMLECVKYIGIQTNKQANVAVEVADRLSEIYERYIHVDS